MGIAERSLAPLLSRLRTAVRIEEIWFEGEPRDTKADLVRIQQFPAPIAGVKNRQSHTLVVDLRLPEQDLWKGVKKNTRNEVRRAEGDGFLCRDATGEPALLELAQAYETLKARKGLLPLNQERLKHLLAAGQLALTCCADAGGRTYSWHVYVLSPPMARLLHSITLDVGDETAEARAVAGRANRLHHWWDMLHLRRLGFESYDLGGWYVGSEDSEKLQINRFKASFGGEVVARYNALAPMTPKGRLAAMILRAVG